MFTMEQIRNITFAIMNQSTLNDRVRVNETKLVQVHQNAIRLDEIDKQMKYDTKVMHEEMGDRLTKFKEEFAAI